MDNEDSDVEMEFAKIPQEQHETYRDVHINPELPLEKQQEVLQLLAEF